MRLLHFSDIHIGMENYSKPLSSLKEKMEELETKTQVSAERLDIYKH